MTSTGGKIRSQNFSGPFQNKNVVFFYVWRYAIYASIKKVSSLNNARRTKFLEKNAKVNVR